MPRFAAAAILAHCSAGSTAASNASSEVWSTWFGTNASCSGPYDVPVSLYAARAIFPGPWSISPALPLAPLLQSDIGGMWAGLGTDRAGDRAWQTWCLQNGTVLLTQYSFDAAAGPQVDGVCEIPQIVEGITYFDARVSSRGPFMFVNGQIIAYWLPALGLSRDRRAAERRAGGQRRGRQRRDFRALPAAAAGIGSSVARAEAFLASVPLCGSANVSTFAGFDGSWMVRFDGGALAAPTALTFSDAEELPGAVVATAYDVLSGAALWSTPAMPHNGTGEYAWAVWAPAPAPGALLLAGDLDFREGASWVALGLPGLWPSNASLVTLAALPAEGTGSFTGAWQGPPGPASPFPVTLQQVWGVGEHGSCAWSCQCGSRAMTLERNQQLLLTPPPTPHHPPRQVTDATFSCKQSGWRDSVVAWGIDGFGPEDWAALPSTQLETCPAPQGTCVTPLVVAWAPLGPGGATGSLRDRS